MYPDFSRPPIRPSTAGRNALAVVGTLVFALALGLFLAVVLNFFFGLAIGIAASAIVYAMFRLSGVSHATASRGESDFDTPDAPRTADREEVRAYRAWRRGGITRFQYERAVARRKYAHGDLTHADLDQVMTYINEAEAGRVRTGSV